MKWVNQYNIQEEIKASETLRNHKQIKQGLEAYEAYIDRISLPTKPVKLTNEEIEQLKKDGRI